MDSKFLPHAAILRNCFFEGEKKSDLGAFLKGKKVTKGSAMLLSWQHRASPFLQLRVGPQVRQKIHAAFIKLVPLKGICVNALLTLTALIYINIYFFG